MNFDMSQEEIDAEMKRREEAVANAEDDLELRGAIINRDLWREYANLFLIFGK